jgi:hypothetical protein
MEIKKIETEQDKIKIETDEGKIFVGKSEPSQVYVNQTMSYVWEEIKKLNNYENL